jgi:hypothetical protein
MLRTAFAVTSLMVGIGLATAPAALADPPYRNCTAAHKDGRYDIPRGDPAYAPHLDRDNDGIACESN